MCFNSSKSSSSSATTDSRTAADNGATSIGANANISIDQSGFHTGDLENVLNFLKDYGQGLKDVTTQSLDTIKAAQINNDNPSQGTVQAVSRDYRIPLTIAFGVVALVIAHKYKVF